MINKHKLQIALSSILLVLAFGYLYRDVIVNLVKIWLEDGNYSHGFLVPIAAGYFVWLKREELSCTPIKPFWPAAILVVLAGLMLLAGQLAIHGFTQHFSMLLMIYALTLFVLGKGYFRILSVPLLFLIFMFPLPYFLKKTISEPLQLFSSFISINFLHLMSYPIYREGNILYLADTTLSVAEACSGLRSIVAMTFASSVLGYLTFANKWKTLILILCAVFLAVLLNWIRITFTVVFADIWGAEIALKIFHDFSGIIVIIVSIIVLTSLLIYLKKREVALPTTDDRKEKFIFPLKSNLYSNILISCCLLVVISIYGNFIFSTKPNSLDLSKLPVRIGEYIGHDNNIPAKVSEVTGVTDDREITYINATQKPVEVYLGYYRTHKNQASFVHSPDICIPGSGWRIETKETVIIKIGNNNYRVLKYVSRQGATKQILLTWIQIGDKVVIGHRQMILNSIYQALIRLRFDDATKVMISTVIGNGETEKEAENRLLDFVHKFYPAFIELSA